MNIPINHKEWAGILRSLAEENASITAYYDETNEYKIPLFSSTNDEGIIASTVGLMDYSQSHEHDIYTEIIIDRFGHDERIFNILATAAFYIIKNNWKVRPGIIFNDIVSMYYPDTNLPHLLFIPPFQWDTISKVQLTNKTIYPLVAVPISEKESQLAESEQDQKLENIWEEQSTNVLDWSRESAV